MITLQPAGEYLDTEADLPLVDYDPEVLEESTYQDHYPGLLHKRFCIASGELDTAALLEIEADANDYWVALTNHKESIAAPGNRLDKLRKDATLATINIKLSIVETILNDRRKELLFCLFGIYRVNEMSKINRQQLR